jgi:hypothetical protein
MVPANSVLNNYNNWYSRSEGKIVVSGTRLMLKRKPDTATQN